MTTPPADDVSRVLAALAGTPDRVIDRFDARVLHLYVEELLTWNRDIPLVSRRDPPAVAARLIERSVRLWDFVCGAAAREPSAPLRRIVDIGTGAGFPGLVWKLIAPDLDITLVERKERKVAFLERVIARSGLEAVAAVAADLREFARYESHENVFELAVMMAVTDPQEVAEPIERLLRVPGYFCVVRGLDQAIARARLGRQLHEIARSDTHEGRFVLYEKTAENTDPA